MTGKAEPVLTKEIAQQFLADNQVVSLNRFAAIDDDAAAILAKYEGFDLYLNGLTSLSDASASSLAKYEGNLELSGLTSLSDAAAASFAKHQGALCLSGLTGLSDAAAENLSRHSGDLYLNGLTSLSTTAAASLAEHDGPLVLDGLTTLSDKAAQSLSRHKGTLSLLGLASLSSDAADSLRGIIHPVVTGASVPLSVVKLSCIPLLQVSAIQSLINDIEQVAYVCRSTHNDEAAWELTFALIKFAYRYEASQNGGRVSKEIADALKADIKSHGVPKENLSELLDWEFEFDDEAKLTLQAVVDNEEDDE